MRKDEDDQRHLRDEYQRAMQYGATDCVLREFQWFPKGIQFESAFNRFVAKETDKPGMHLNAPMSFRCGSNAKHDEELLKCIIEAVRTRLYAK